MKLKTLEEFSSEIEKSDPAVFKAAQEIKKEIMLKLELRSIREELGENQSAIFEAMSIKQSAVSRIEKKGANSKLATIKEYLSSLGCTSVLQVTMPNGKVKSLEI